VASSTNYPGTGADYGAVGSKAWTNPSGITTEGGGVASAALSGAFPTSHFLKGSNFGFAVPDGVTVVGVTAEIMRADADETDQLFDSAVKLVKGGAVAGDNKASPTPYPPSATELATFKPDERSVDGLYRLGFSRFYMLVDDHAAAPPPKNANPKSLHDSALARYQLKKWRHLDVRDSETERGPEKRNDNFGNGLMFCVHDGLPVAVALSYDEKLQVASPRLRELTDKMNSRTPLTPGVLGCQAEAKKRVKPSVRRWDEYGERMN
jgi:hypothetical protein